MKSLKLFLASIVLLAAVVRGVAGQTPDGNNSRGGSFIIGADISWVPEDEAAGAEYFDHGVKRDIFEILKERGFNYVRLRVFVNPKSTNGYARHMSEAFCDVAHTLAMARRAKAAGMGVLLDVHYGDTWTSPGHQEKPVAWQTLDFPGLTNAVREFTREVVLALKTNGTPAAMVAVGNEISDGMLFPDGRRSNFDKFAALVQAGIAGAKAADPAVKIMLHHHLGRSNERMREWLDNFIARGTQFDVIGMSCYSQAAEGDWEKNFADLAKRYPKHGLIAVEYSGRKRVINVLIFNAPDKKGLGTFIWEPTRHREAFFDREGRNAGGGANPEFVEAKPTNAPATTTATNVANAAVTRVRERHGGRYDVNELIDVYPQMARDYGNIPAAK